MSAIVRPGQAFEVVVATHIAGQFPMVGSAFVNPTGRVYRNGVHDAAVTVTATSLAYLNLWRLSFTAPSGYADGDRVVVAVAYKDAFDVQCQAVLGPYLVQPAGAGGSSGSTTIESRGITVAGGG